ncbi:MAG: rhodanese-like domain-containing protein [Selenomonadaceae bacterium]|nr:rhodanese-like domain-containing protein [Selenomonadaceae bacterium]
MLKIFSKILLMSLLTLFIIGCGGGGNASTPEETNFKKITQEEAQKMMDENPEAIILDVREQKEYDEKHVKGALLVPLDDIKAGKLSKLPDKNATILVYCRTGRRSTMAAKILADNGYKNIYEFGGINDWQGATE